MISKRAIFILFIFIFLSFFNGFASVQQDTTKTDHSGLPSKESITAKKHGYSPNAIDEYNNAYYVLSRLNKSIGLPPNNFNLQTPQATLEHFIVSARNKKYNEAAYALNFNLLPDNLTKKETAILAEKLYFVINQRINIDWDGLSDRPDGQTDISTTTNKAIAGKPRRSVVFGEIDLNGKDVVMRLQRVKYKDYGAFWLISANTVENIEPLYKVYGPRELDRMMPDWARLKFWSMPIWKFVGALILIFICFYLGKLVAYLLQKIFLQSDKNWINDIANKLAKPAGIAFGTLVFYILLNELISFSGTWARIIYALLLITLIGAITWFFMRLIDYFMEYFTENRIGDATEEENSEARRMLTYISVARRVLTFMVIIFGISVVLSQFRSLEKLGISLMASAGVATVILGLAAQSTLGNIIAGIQIAITKPARIGDTVIIKEDWGYVEDIRFTYMVVRTWDLRRLVVPLKYVISNTFENWSMNSAHQIRPIMLYADYQIDVEKVRQKFIELVKNSENWDEENEPKLQVSDVTEKAIQMRALCSAKDASTTWDLHCKLREEIVQYIAELEEGSHLTKSRVKLEGDSLKNEG